MQNLMTEVADLLGLPFNPATGEVNWDTPDFTFSLTSKAEIITARIDFKRPLPGDENQRKEAMKALTNKNYRLAIAGFFVDPDTGRYSQKQHFTFMEEKENIAHAVYVLLSEASSYLV